MQIRRTADRDRPALLRLWREAFSEDGSWFFSRINAKGWCAENGGLLAMAFALPQTLVTEQGEFPAAYLYAVATAKAARGKGVATELIRAIEADLKADGVSGVVLVPAEQSLFPFYDRMGYRVWAYRQTAIQAGGKPCSAEEYLSLRKAMLPKPFLQPSVEIAECYRFFQTAGGAYALDDNGAVRESLPATQTGAPFAMAKAFSEVFPQQGYFSLALD